MSSASHEKNRRFVILSILSAIIIIQNFVSFLGYIPIPPINPTVIQVTVIIGAVVLGPVSGAILGGVWGVVCLIRAFVYPTSPVDPIIFTNPLISVLPRVVIGIVAGLAFKGMRRLGLNRVASGAICGVIGSITNTVLVLGGIFLIYREQYAALTGVSADAVFGLMMGIVAINGVAEMAVSGVLVPCISRPLLTMMEKSK